MLLWKKKYWLFESALRLDRVTLMLSIISLYVRKHSKIKIFFINSGRKEDVKADCSKSSLQKLPSLQSERSVNLVVKFSAMTLQNSNKAISGLRFNGPFGTITHDPSL